MRQKSLRFSRKQPRWLQLRILVPLTFPIVVVLASLAFWMRNTDPKSADLLIAAAGWVLTFAGILLAGEQMVKGQVLDALSKLHDEEIHPDQRAAKIVVWEAAQAIQRSENVYRALRTYVTGLSAEQREHLDQARRRLTNFWHRAAWMVELGVLTPEQIFTGVSSPAILEVLEPLEAITLEGMQSDISPTPWPPLRLLKAWYRYRGDNTIARQLPLTLPAHPALYTASRDHRPDLPVQASAPAAAEPAVPADPLDRGDFRSRKR